MFYANPKKVARVMAITGIAVLGAGCGSNPTGVGATGLPGVQGVVPGGGCIPLTSPVGFTGSATSNNTNILAGLIPPNDPQYGGRSFGNVIVSGGGQGGPYQTLPGAGSGSSISANYTPGTTVSPGAAGTTGTFSGTLTISPQIVQRAQLGNLNGLSSFGTLGSNPTGTSCVSGLGFNLALYRTTLYAGFVYVKLNNTEHGFVIPF